MGRSRVTENVLAWKVDKTSQREVARATNEVANDLERVAKASTEATTRTRTQMDSVESDLIGKSDTAVAALGGLTGALGFAGTETIMLSSDILGLVDAFTPFREELMKADIPLGALIGGLGAAALVIGAVSLATADWTKKLEEARAEAERFTGATEQVTQDFANLTSAEVQERTEALFDTITGERAQMELLGEAVLEQLTGAISMTPSVEAEFRERFLGALKRGDVDAAERLVETFANVGNASEIAGTQIDVLIEGLRASQGEIDESYQVMQLFTTETVQARIALNDAIAAEEEFAAESSTFLSGVVGGIREGLTNITDFVSVQNEAVAEAWEEQQQITERRNKEIADAVKSYNDDVARLETDALRQRADLEERYADQLVSIAQNAADAAENALHELEQTQADATRDLARDLAEADREAQRSAADARLEFQRDEAKAARDHAREMLRIQEEAKDQEFDAIAARDFASLFRIRRDTRKRLEEESSSYSDERSERQIALGEQLQDLRTELQQERADRQIAYQQQIADARAAYEQERAEIAVQKQQQLQTLQTAHQQELMELQKKHVTEMNLRRQAAQQELQFLMQTEQQRAAILAQTQQTLLNQAKSMMTGIQAGAAGGGVTNRYTKTLQAPQTFNIQGRDPQAIARAVRSETQRVIYSIMRD